MRTSAFGLRRTLAVLAVLAAVVAACGSDRPGAGNPAGGAAGSPTGAGTGTTTGSNGATAGAVGGGSGGSAGGGASGPSASSVSPSSASAPAVIAVGSLDIGQVAPALLRPGRGDRVVLEVRAQQGAAPTTSTIDHVSQVLGSVSHKAVAVDGPDLLGGGARDWTQKDIISAAASAAQTESGRSQVVLRVLFLHGTYGGDTSVLGVAVAGDVAAVFSDQVDSAAGLLVAPSVVEDAVTMHEVGHLLGLVDLYLHTGRADPDHPGHSRNKRSVMYWQVESDLITQLLDGGIPRDFDSDDLADLATIRSS